MKAPRSLQDAENKYNEILTKRLTPRVVIDQLGNTVSANEYRREQLDFLASDIRRIAWSPQAHAAAHAIADRADARAREFARG